ncbi:MAG: carbon-nitrogen hydrolase family protein [Firmicutes bacterium]|nr:carbon-nitrogen hydrolase family protein [Bacillota bacterium]
MKIGLVSEKFIDGEILNNLFIIEKRLKENIDCDLLLFGEAFLHGFDALSWEYKKDIEIAITSDSNEIQKIQQLAKENSTAVGFGYFEQDNNDPPNIYCSYAIIDKNGKLIFNYRRMSKGWKEFTKTCDKYKEENKITIGEIEGKKFLCFICGDLWDDNILNNAKLITKKHNCDFIIWPNCLDYSIEQWKTEINDYAQRVKNIKPPTLLINSHSETANGGVAVFKNGKTLSQLKMGKIDILTTKI